MTAAATRTTSQADAAIITRTSNAADGRGVAVGEVRAPVTAAQDRGAEHDLQRDAAPPQQMPQRRLRVPGVDPAQGTVDGPARDQRQPDGHADHDHRP